jgi:hypothetical protein
LAPLPFFFEFPCGRKFEDFVGAIFVASFMLEDLQVPDKRRLGGCVAQL